MLPEQDTTCPSKCVSYTNINVKVELYKEQIVFHTKKCAEMPMTQEELSLNSEEMTKPLGKSRRKTNVEAKKRVSPQEKAVKSGKCC